VRRLAMALPGVNNFPAVLVRLPAIGKAALRQVITQAWRCMAPAALVAAFDAGELRAAPRRKVAAPRRKASSVRKRR
jgi:hypothetical protein